ncbi:alpha/beta fold hydrolase [Actinoplanes sp. NPDC051343]|uniref:alpha/beta fold hydrolase n=1 Tax=Actinoplanes sp. NPDC051343 TaxID=3363906 RepID=UPI0037924F70
MIDRRNFIGKSLGIGAGTALAATVATAAPAMAARKGDDHVPVAGLHTFDTPKQVKAGLLNVGYAEIGPANGPVVICLHGYPYGTRSFAVTAPLLADRGYRVIVPYLRGYGTTRFLTADTFRNGQQAALGVDLIAFMDALKINKAVLAGFDWGTSVACVTAALWPERCKAIVATTGYAITSLAANLQPASAEVEHNWWYRSYFATERGRLAMEDPQKRRDLNRLDWQLTSPTVDDAVFDSVAVAFDNPDHAAIVIHHYRWQLSIAAGERQYDALEAKLAKLPAITVPSVALDPDRDPFTPPGEGASYRNHFTGRYEHRTLKGIGAHVPWEAPVAFADAVMTAARL